MPNAENLKPQNKRTKSEQREIARAGGIASGKARREKKWFREEIEKQIGDNIVEAIKAVWFKAQKGDVQAIQFLRDTIGEKPTDKVENTNVEMSYEDYIKKVESEDEY